MSTSLISRDDILNAVAEAVRSIGAGRLEKSDITPEARFNELGIDSFGVVTLLVSVEARLKLDLSKLTQVDVKLKSIQDFVTLVESVAGQ